MSTESAQCSISLALFLTCRTGSQDQQVSYASWQHECMSLQQYGPADKVEGGANIITHINMLLYG
jgi:hypothetical protein